MKPHVHTILTVGAIALAAISANARPLDYNELSLLVRAREPESSIASEASRRKLSRALTPQQESTLKTQGATETLVENLRKPAMIAAAASDTAALESKGPEAARAPDRAPAPALEHNSAGHGDREHYHVFEVGVGQPVNLSRWGGPDYEFAFNAPERLQTGRADLFLVDNVRSFTHTATYLGAGRPDDSTTIFDRRNYVSVMDHSFTRGLWIDWSHPTTKHGVPYNLYPVYAAGSVSLYYIGATSDSVKLAVAVYR